MYLDTTKEYIEFIVQNDCKKIIKLSDEIYKINKHFINRKLIKAIEIIKKAKKVNINNLFEVYNFIHNVNFSNKKILYELNKIPAFKKDIVSLFEKGNKKEAIYNLINQVISNEAFALKVLYKYNKFL